MLNELRVAGTGIQVPFAFLLVVPFNSGFSRLSSADRHIHFAAERQREANRLHKALEDTGIKLDCVATDILGVSGRAMLDALVAGTSDPQAGRRPSRWPPPAPKAATSKPNTSASSPASGTAARSAPSSTRCSSPTGTCSPPARPTANSAATTTSAATPNA
jgi:transposase